MRRPELPGLAVVAVAVAAAFVLSSLVDASPLVVGVAMGVIVANLGLVRPTFAPGLAVAAKPLLRLGVVLFGLRVSMDEVRSLGVAGAVGVVAVVVLTFVGVRVLARLFGLSNGMGLLVATGYSICGASAVAAMAPLSDADEEETAYAIGLVTMFGSLSIVTLPVVGRLLGLGDETFGVWSGAAVHDVGQVTATAAAYSGAALATATLVKLTRVAMLAPLVLAVGARRRSARAESSTAGAPNVPLVPWFVVGFLATVAVRAADVLSADTLAVARDVEQVLLTCGMLGLGTGVVVSRLRRLGGRPLLLGAVSWVLVAGAALAMALVVS